MKRRLFLPLAAAVAALLAAPAAAQAAPAPAPGATQGLTGCQAYTVPLYSPVTGDFVGYMTEGLCSGSGTFYVHVTCPDGTGHDGNVVTLPTSGLTVSLTGCGRERPVEQSVVVVG